jgi:hypothetical protein
VIAPHTPLFQSFLMLRDLVLLQSLYGLGSEPYPTATLRRLRQAEGLAVGSQGLPDVQPPVVEVLLGASQSG